MTDAYDAFLLVSFGGPEGPDDVMPFLENVTRGRGIPRERLEAVSHHYLALGGVSPINEQNRRLVAALRAEFEARGVGLPVYWGNRNWGPFLTAELECIHADGHRRVLALATSVYSSYSGCRQYREDVARSLAETGLDGRLGIDKLRNAFDHPGFIEPFVEGLAAALAELAERGFAAADTRVLFTTHSIPLTMAAASGPGGGAYVAQHLAAIELVVDRIRSRGTEVPDHALVYQSRSGAPGSPWLEPDVNDALRDAHADGMRAAVIVPIGFVSDHVEVVWDLDHEARETCDGLGVAMVRVATPGTHPAFVAGIADLVQERMAGTPPVSLSPLGPLPAACAVGCCANARADLPTVAGIDSTFGRLAGPASAPGHPSQPSLETEGVPLLADHPVFPILLTTDMAAGRAFYHETLGLPIATEDDERIVLQCGGGTGLILSRSTSGTSDTQTQVTWRVPDIRAAIADLRARGVRIEDYAAPDPVTVDGVADMGHSWAAWFIDPSRNVLAVIQPKG